MDTNRFAIVFANQKYESQDIGEDISSDATHIAKALKKCNFHVTMIENATAFSMVQNIIKFVRMMQQEKPTVTFFYFSGICKGQTMFSTDSEQQENGEVEKGNIGLQWYIDLLLEHISNKAKHIIMANDFSDERQSKEEYNLNSLKFNMKRYQFLIARLHQEDSFTNSFIELLQQENETTTHLYNNLSEQVSSLSIRSTIEEHFILNPYVIDNPYTPIPEENFDDSILSPVKQLQSSNSPLNSPESPRENTISLESPPQDRECSLVKSGSPTDKSSKINNTTSQEPQLLSGIREEPTLQPVSQVNITPQKTPSSAPTNTTTNEYEEVMTSDQEDDDVEPRREIKRPSSPPKTPMRTPIRPIKRTAEDYHAENASPIVIREFIPENTSIIASPSEKVPTIPDHFVERDEMMSDIKLKLIRGSAVRAVVLRGPLGCGKTTLVSALAHDTQIQSHFTDGVYWVKLGNNVIIRDILHRMNELVKDMYENLTQQMLLDERPTSPSFVSPSKAKPKSYSSIEPPGIISNEQEGKEELLRLTENRKMLIILDSVHQARNLYNFLVAIDTPSVKLMITTEVENLIKGSFYKEYVLEGGMTSNESTNVVSRIALSPEAKETMDQNLMETITGKLPFNIQLYGNMMNMFDNVFIEKHSTKESVIDIQSNFESYPFSRDQQQYMRSFILISILTRLMSTKDEEDDTRYLECFHALSICPEHKHVPITIMYYLWDCHDMEELDDIVERLENHGLISIEQKGGDRQVNIHPIVVHFLEYANKHYLKERHLAFLKVFASKCPKVKKSKLPTTPNQKRKIINPMLTPRTSIHSSMRNYVSPYNQEILRGGAPQTPRSSPRPRPNLPVTRETRKTRQMMTEWWNPKWAPDHSAELLNTYYYQYLFYHLAAAGKVEPMKDILLHYQWYYTKIQILDVQSIISDFSNVPGFPHYSDVFYSAVHDALLSAIPILSLFPEELPSQLFGRLVHLQGEVRRLLSSCIKFHRLAELPFRYTALGYKTGMTPAGRTLLTQHIPTSKPIQSVAMTPDCQSVMMIDASAVIKRFNLNQGTTESSFESDADWCLVVTPAGKHYITGSYAEELRVWEINSGEHVFSLENEKAKFVRIIAMAPNGKYVAAAANDKRVKIFDIEKKRVHRFIEDVTRVTDITFGIDSKSLFIATETGLIVQCLTKTGKEVVRYPFEPVYGAWVNSLCTSHLHLFAACMFDNQILMFDIASGELLRVFPVQGPTSVAVNSSNFLFVGTEEGYLEVFNIHSGDLINVKHPFDDKIVKLMLTPDQQHLSVLDASSCRLTTFDIRDLVEPSLLEEEAPLVIDQCHPYGKNVLVATRDEACTIWNMEKACEIDAVVMVEGKKIVSPDGRYIVVIDNQNQVQFWDVLEVSETPYLVFDSFQKPILNALLTAQDHHLILFMEDRIVCLDSLTGDCLYDFTTEDDHRVTALDPQCFHFIQNTNDQEFAVVVDRSTNSLLLINLTTLDGAERILELPDVSSSAIFNQIAVDGSTIVYGSSSPLDENGIANLFQYNIDTLSEACVQCLPPTDHPSSTQFSPLSAESDLSTTKRHPLVTPLNLNGTISSISSAPKTPTPTSVERSRSSCISSITALTAGSGTIACCVRTTRKGDTRYVVQLFDSSNILQRITFDYEVLNIYYHHSRLLVSFLNGLTSIVKLSS